MMSRFLRTSLAVGVPLVAIAALVLPRALPAAAPAKKSLGFVITDYNLAGYETKYFDECPEGLAIGNDELWWKALSPQDRDKLTNSGLIEPGRDADFVFMDRAQHTAGRTLLESVQLGDIPGVGMVMIDGIVRAGRSRNTPPAERVPQVVAG